MNFSFILIGITIIVFLLLHTIEGMTVDQHCNPVYDPWEIKPNCGSINPLNNQCTSCIWDRPSVIRSQQYFVGLTGENDIANGCRPNPNRDVWNSIVGTPGSCTNSAIQIQDYLGGFYNTGGRTSANKYYAYNTCSIPTSSVQNMRNNGTVTTINGTPYNWGQMSTDWGTGNITSQPIKGGAFQGAYLSIGTHIPGQSGYKCINGVNTSLSTTTQEICNP